MSAAVTHQRVSDDVSANRVNRVNPAQGVSARSREDHGGTVKIARQVWSNIEALKALLARADRELAREPGGYVAVAVVGADKREEQVGRWAWAGSRDAGGRVAVVGNGLVAGARGLRVRVHREGGGLVGSALLRRATAVPDPERVPSAASDSSVSAMVTDRLAVVEALLARAVARLEGQDRELTALKGTIGAMGPVRESMGNLHARLDDLEAVAHRHGDPEDREDQDEEEDEVCVEDEAQEGDEYDDDAEEDDDE